MRAFRFWLVDLLLDCVRRAHPSAGNGVVWQIIEVPRRITRTEADDLAAQVKNL